jgi:hypothetical protein
MNQYSITIIIAYFGEFPEWSALYFETLRRNSTIQFIFYTDNLKPAINAPNVIFRTMSFDAYKKKASTILGFTFNPSSAYKLCDLRPLIGIVHFEDLKGADFFGWADMDLLFGDIRSFYTNSVLADHEVFSTHAHIVSGHLALFKNSRKHRMMFQYLGGWKEKLLAHEYVGIDELLLRAYARFDEETGRSKKGIVKRLFGIPTNTRMYLVEQYTTPFTTLPWLDGSLNSAHPSTWFYKDGRISNDRDGDRKFMYLHLMNFKSSKYRHDGTQAPWEGKVRICFADVGDMKKGLKIDPTGIHPLSA